MHREGPPSDDDRERTTPTPGGASAADQVRAEQSGLRAIDRERRARLAKVTVALAIVVILLIFITTNVQGVKVHFVFFSATPPLIWVMFACAALGGVVGYLIGKPGKQIVRGHDRGKDRPGRFCRLLGARDLSLRRSQLCLTTGQLCSRT